MTETVLTVDGYTSGDFTDAYCEYREIADEDLRKQVGKYAGWCEQFTREHPDDLKGALVDGGDVDSLLVKEKCEQFCSRQYNGVLGRIVLLFVLTLIRDVIDIYINWLLSSPVVYRNVTGLEPEGE